MTGNDIFAVSVMSLWALYVLGFIYPERAMKFFNLFKSPSVTPVEKWATHNAKKATPDDLIAGAIVASFAKDYKHWKFTGEFNQKHSNTSGFTPTSLSRKVSGKKHITILFLFKETHISDDYSSVYKYKPISCEVNGIRISDAAFYYIIKNWNNIVVEMRRTEEVAAEAKAAMETNESKWNLAEELNNFKRDKKGALRPKTAYEHCSGTCLDTSCSQCREV